MLYVYKVYVFLVYYNFICISRNLFYVFFYLKLERKIIKGIMYNIFNIVMELLDIYLIVSC